MTFKQRLSIGSVGETIIKDYLISQGWVVYAPLNHPHPFDFLCYKNDKSFIAEVKTKAVMNKYFATGIPISHYDTYKQFQTQYNIPVFIFFVDTSLGFIYGNYLDELEKPTELREEGTTVHYPLIMQKSGVVVFPIVNMRMIAPISQINGSGAH